jgi:REP element-mobilizing transposase RayT
MRRVGDIIKQMDDLPTQPQRKSIRLPGYDYTRAGAYFVTLVAWQQEPIFGEILFGAVRLHPPGDIVQSAWRHLPLDFPVELDEMIIMPNHMHAILWIDEMNPQAIKPPSQTERRNGAIPGSLGAILGNFKSVTARRINQIRSTSGASVWQRNYYEHIVRNEDDLRRIRAYICDNPRRWTEKQYSRHEPE